MKDSILQPEVNNIFRSRRRWISKGELISGSIWYFLFPKTWSGAKSGQHVQHPPFQSIYIYILLDSSSFFHLYKWHTRDYNATTTFPAMTAGGHWSLSDLEYFGAEEVRGLMTSGWKWVFFVGIWVKQGTFLHPYATMCAMLRMKTLEISWVFMNCTRMKSSLKP